MDLTTFATGPELLERAGNFLRDRELEHGWHVAVATRLTDPSEAPYLAAVESAGRIVAVAMRAPPHKVMLSHIAPDDRADALASLVVDLRTRYGSLPGVFGPRDEATEFAQHWARATQAIPRVAMRLREFVLARVEPPANVPGAMRVATPDDLPRIHAWNDAFIDETGLPEADRLFATRERISTRIATGAYWLWTVDDVACAMAAGSTTAPRIARVGPVYTPPEQRKCGYGSALTAAVSQHLLDHGSWRVCLSTDLANPTSNHIYQALGYRPLSDRVTFAFDVVAT